MGQIELSGTTGCPRVDELLCGLIGVFETVFPTRVRGYYLIGSYADGNPLPTSDIDGVILFKNNFLNNDEEQKAWRLLEHCAELSGVELDIEPIPEQRFNQYENVALKWASLLLYGEDVRDHVPVPPIDEYIRRSMYSAYLFIARARNQPPYLTFPLDYPDPADEFYGYAAGQIVDQAGNSGPSLKRLINCVGKPARALVAEKARIYIKTKGDCLTQYQVHIHDEWTQLLEATYSNCRALWHYRVPEDANARQALRELCREALGFENYFLAHYRLFLLRELEQHQSLGQWMPRGIVTQTLGISAKLLQQQMQQGVTQIKFQEREEYVWVEHPGQIMAINMLGKIIFPGDLVISKQLQTFISAEDVYLRGAAMQTLASIQNNKSPNNPVTK